MAAGTKAAAAAAPGGVVGEGQFVHSPPVAAAVGQYEWPNAWPGDGLDLGLEADGERLGEVEHHLPHCAWDDGCQKPQESHCHDLPRGAMPP